MNASVAAPLVVLFGGGVESTSLVKRFLAESDATAKTKKSKHDRANAPTDFFS